MYVRDHTRPQLKAATGLQPTDDDYEVFRITNEMKQASVSDFPSDIDHPAFRQWSGQVVSDSNGDVPGQGPRGYIAGRLKQGAWAVAGLMTFARLYVLPVKTPSTAGAGARGSRMVSA